MLEPLRAMITGTPLEDARHLAQRYSKMRQEAEAHVSTCIYALYLRLSSFYIISSIANAALSN